MRLFFSHMSCWYTTAGGYSGTHDSDSMMKRWFRGFFRASLIRTLDASASDHSPHPARSERIAQLMQPC